MVAEGVVLVVDDDVADRRLTAGILRAAGFDTRELSGRDAARSAYHDGDQPPAAVVMNVSLEGITGYEVCRRIRIAHGDDIGIVFLSADRTEPIDRVAGLLLGADDYLVKPFLPDELTARVLRLVRRNGHGNGSRHPAADGSGNGSSRGNGLHHPYELTDRELQVLGLLAAGHDQAEVARRLVVSSTTIGTHIQRILSKLGVHNRAQAVALALRESLVT
jgi:DNA-binding NarL/FixJ family response regulator